MNSKLFSNKTCEFYPCHEMAEDINCLFCYCPLFLTKCDGSYSMLGDIKDCSKCSLPHIKDNYFYIISMLNKNLNSRKIKVEDVCASDLSNEFMERTYGRL